jgi:drug/metabolite transporter (DMT)-like permease
VEANVTLIWLGALLIVGGVVLTAIPPMLQGRLSRVRRVQSPRPSNTLEPERPAKGLSLQNNWPGLALMVLGAILMLIGATF